jgi:hypothetical protein
MSLTTVDCATTDALSSRTVFDHHHHDESLCETLSYESREPLSLNILWQLSSHMPLLICAKGSVYAEEKDAADNMSWTIQTVTCSFS